MKIYHYTNIESLALILKCRTLLFNRLDCVDDVEEGSVSSMGINVGKYVFVSCWTESTEESIPLWKMYGGDKMGVRIGLEKDMFQKYKVDIPLIGDPIFKDHMVLGISQEELATPDYYVLPVHENSGEFFYRKIQYVDNVAEKTKNAVVITPKENGDERVYIGFGEVGRYKHNRWAFQDETRFVLTILPFNPLLSKPEQVGTIAMDAYAQNKPINFKHFFMHLKESVLNNIEITISPNATEGQRVLIEALTKCYAPGATIKESSLGHLVRM